VATRGAAAGDDTCGLFLRHTTCAHTCWARWWDLAVCPRARWASGARRIPAHRSRGVRRAARAHHRDRRDAVRAEV